MKLSNETHIFVSLYTFNVEIFLSAKELICELTFSMAMKVLSENVDNA